MLSIFFIKKTDVIIIPAIRASL